MTEQGNIIGLNLGIDDNYLTKVVEQTVIAGISESLNGKNEIVSQLVHDVLNLKVNANGCAPKYSTDATYTLLEWHVRRAINDVAKEEVAAVIEESKPKIREAISKELRKKGAIDNLAEAFVGKLTRDVKSGWRTSVNIEFEVDND